VVFVLVAVVSVDRSFSRLVITTDDSTPFTFFWKSERQFEKGDYVMVKGKAGTLAEGKFLTKQVLCVPGEVLYKKGTSFYCCSDESLGKCEFLHVAVEKTPKGRKLFPFNPCGGDAYRSSCVVVVPGEKFYLGTGVPSGYDSRYVGFFKKDEVLTRLEPIF